MAKTFDNISEASATNYLFLFAQRTLALQDEPPTPPPLNVLGLPCKAICMLRDLMRSKDKASSTDKTSSAAEITLNLEASAEAEKAEASVETAEAETAEASSSSSPLSPESEEVTRGEETPLHGEEKPLVVKTFTEKVTPLAKQITEYILDHQDDAAQEDRWRTTMKREMGKSFREQHEEMKKVKDEVQQTVKAEIKAEVQKVKAEVQKVETEMQSMQLKFDEIADLIKQQLGKPVIRATLT